MTTNGGTPSIGRIVHYVSYGSAGGKFPSVCRAAVITEVSTEVSGEEADDPADRIGLAAINPTGMFYHSLADGGCDHDVNKAGGTWHWPERLE